MYVSRLGTNTNYTNGGTGRCGYTVFGIGWRANLLRTWGDAVITQGRCEQHTTELSLLGRTVHTKFTTPEMGDDMR